MLPMIALRNLSRNRRRTLFSLLVISFGSAALLLTAGFMRYSFDGLSDAIIRGGLGHLEVIPTRGLEGSASPTDRSARPPALDGWQEMQTAIEARPHVRAAGAAIQFAGVATNRGRSASFFGVAVEPARERRMGVETKLRGGAGLPEDPPAEGEDGVLLGTGLAHALVASPGDTITVMTATADGSLNALDLRVVGLFSTGLQELDGRIVKTHLTTAQRLLGTDRVTSIVVGLDHTAETREAKLDLKGTLAGSASPLEVVDWETRAPFYGQVRALYRGIFAFLGIIIALLVALSNSNTLLMSVLDRVREFGTLLAIGTSRAQLAGLVVLEAIWLALIGGVAGSALGMTLVLLINAVQIDMPAPPGAADPLKLVLAMAPSDFLWVISLLPVILTVASIPPMVRVFRLQIVDALGHV
jgi:putative ABC transport system permease protein